jgi:hypothetical protein
MKARKAKGTRLQRGGQVVPENCDCRAKAGEDDHPEQHGTFMLPPRGGDLVEHRFQRVRIRGDDFQRKVRTRERPDEANECKCNERKLRDRRRSAEAHQARLAMRSTPQGYDALRDRNHQCKEKSEKSEFADQGRLALYHATTIDVVVMRAPATH